MRKRRKEQPDSSAAGNQPVRKRTRKRIFLWAFLIVVLALCGIHLFSNELETTFYHLYSPKIRGAEKIGRASCRERV